MAGPYSTAYSLSEAERACAAYKRLSAKRGTWESHWREAAERVLPSHAQYFHAGPKYNTPGQKHTEFQYDATANVALGRFTAIVDSLLTPRNQVWHMLKADNPYLRKEREVKLYFEEVNRVLFEQRYLPTANFVSQNLQVNEQLGCFGTGAIFTDELFGTKGLRYRSPHLSQLYFEENHQGQINACIRYYPTTARQMVTRWPKTTPEKIKGMLATSPDAEIYVIHYVYPREDRDPERADYKGMAFKSVYVCESEKVLLEEGGYNTFPYAVGRYSQSPGEIFGRGPALDVLPAIKVLNEQKKTIIKQGHRAVDPALLAHDDGVIDELSLLPGAVNWGGVSADGRPLVHTLPVGNHSIGKDLMDDERNVINDAFLITLFQILVETRAMTATEVLERTREKGILLAPTIGRQENERLGPQIEREIDILSRQGLLPPMPDVLLEAKGEYTVVYDNPMSRAARAEEAVGLMRTMEQAINVASTTGNMEALDHFDFDVAIPELAEIQAVPARWMRSPKDIEDIRQGRAQAKQAEQAIQAAPAAAAIVKAGK